MMIRNDSDALTLLSLPEREVLSSLGDTILCLGNFDGVHIGHLALLQEAKRLHSETFPDASCGVFSFREPPTSFLPGRSVPRLCTSEDKLFLFAESGMTFAALGDFPALRDLSPTDFVREICEKRLHAKALVCGFNFRFGKNGAGTPETLKKVFSGTVSVLPPICSGGIPVSSTRIRDAVLSGRVEEAAQLLSRPYFLTAPVVHGKALGRKLGFPTVNQQFDTPAVVPMCGVYETRCEIDGVVFRSVSNVGRHPTVDDDAAVNCETHLIGFSGDLYGRVLKVEFIRFLRPETKFGSPAELSEQIALDLKQLQN